MLLDCLSYLKALCMEIFFLTKFQLKKGSFIGCSQLMDPSSTKIEHAIEENDTDSELFITDIQSTLIPEDNSIK